MQRVSSPTAGSPTGDAEAALDGILLRGAIDSITIPNVVEFTDETRKMTAAMLDLCRRRIVGMA